MMDPLESLMSLLGGPREKYEPLAPLSTEEAKEWESVQNEIGKIKTLAQEIEARKRIFWAVIQRRLNNYNGELKIENGMVLEKVEKKTNCNHPGQALQGFCEGNCANCALNPNKDQQPDLL
jgi:hypothetical protein